MKSSAFLLFVLFKSSLQCGSVGGGADGRIYTNPSLQWEMSPPAAWTYPVSYAQQTGQFFAQQPLTQQDAINKAQSDMQSAVLTALSENDLPTNNVRVSTGYSAQQVSDCVKVTPTSTGQGIPSTTTANQEFGVEEQGAITRLAQSSMDVPVAMCAARSFTMVTYRPNIVQGSLQINGLTLSGFQLRSLVGQIQSLLSFRSHVRFQTPITYS
ncbi:unnamed protein product [Bursaphelenchus xylophilus]|uniref:(pine wood nematode) hypothetical protein n=1 Tax=Bursaphelenchus xylophilus TaxID=6326 RepID=A0A1I7RSK7_BURXY|nr:unnamed protein product [Bursaphelenchus xylophilus]CAG9122887.1 unnamed protein product [Bursaphelenchus xylophilus]